jgi:hypothetical protein
VQHWHNLRPRTQHQIHQEIAAALRRNEVGNVIHIAMWQDVAQLPLAGMMTGPLPTIPYAEAVIGVDVVLALIDEVEATYPSDVFPDTGTTPDALAGMMARLVCAQLRDRFRDIVDAVANGDAP